MRWIRPQVFLLTSLRELYELRVVVLCICEEFGVMGLCILEEFAVVGLVDMDLERNKRGVGTGETALLSGL